MTLAARPRDGKESLLEAYLAVSVARGTRGRPRAFFGAGAIAFSAAFVPGHFDLRCGSKCGVLEGEIEIVPKVSAALRLIAAFENSPMAGLVDLKSVDVSGTEVLSVLTGQGSQITFALDRIEDQLRYWRLVYDYGKKIGKVIRTLDLSVTNNAPVLWLEARAPPSPAPEPLKPIKKKHV